MTNHIRMTDRKLKDLDRKLKDLYILWDMLVSDAYALDAETRTATEQLVELLASPGFPAQPTLAKSVNLTLQAVADLGASLEETQRQLAELELKEGQ